MKINNIKIHVKDGIKVLKVILINLIVLSILFELGSLGLYWLKHKKFFYTRPMAKSYQELGINMEGVRLGDSVVERFHPFFGFVKKPSPDFRPGFKTNNYGFTSPYDYPIIKTDKKQFIIGILGGSVADNLSVFEVQNKIIASHLKKLPQFQDKEFMVLSLATGGYKQPQQLILLNYFLSLGQQFDLIINVDGFNEVALSNINNQAGIATTMPSLQHIGPLATIASHSLSRNSIEIMGRLNDTKQKLQQGINKLFACRLASCHSIYSLFVQSLINQYRTDLMRFDREIRMNPQGESIVYLNKEPHPLDNVQAFDKISSHWARSSVLIKKLLDQNNIPYFHFLQPNQYYQTQRVFSEGEKQIAFSDQTPYNEGVKLGYPKLLEKTKKLTKNQVNFFSAINILDNVKEPVYVDSCCHYNDIGQRVFLEYIGDSIVKTIAKNPEKFTN